MTKTIKFYAREDVVDEQEHALDEDVDSILDSPVDDE